MVVTMHDLAWERVPEAFPEDFRRYARRSARRSVRRAARVIAVSESTSRDLRELYGVPAERLRVVPNGVDPDTRPPGPRRAVHPERRGPGGAQADRASSRPATPSTWRGRAGGAAALPARHRRRVGRATRRACGPRRARGARSAASSAGRRCSTSTAARPCWSTRRRTRASGCRSSRRWRPGARCCARATRRWSRWAGSAAIFLDDVTPEGIAAALAEALADREALARRGEEGRERGRPLLVAGGGDGDPRRLPAGAPPMSRGAAGRAGRWRPLVAHSYRLGAAWAARGARGGGWPSSRGRASTGCSCRSSRGATTSWPGWPPSRSRATASTSRARSCSRACCSARGAGAGRRLTSCPTRSARWRDLDPALDLRVEDARALSFADGSFDAVACVSVIEHVEGDGDAAAMAEMWRVLRPGGVLHLTTNVAARAHDVLVDRPVYGGAPDGRAGATSSSGATRRRACASASSGCRGRWRPRSTWSSAARCTSASSRRGRPRFWPGGCSARLPGELRARWRARPRCRRDGTGWPTCAFAGRDDGPPDRQDARPRSRNPQGWSRASDPGRTRPRDRRGAAAPRRQYDRVVSAARRHGTAVTTRAWNALGTAEGSP